jgi:glycosyltransferase involved in cell wall biosynthesis
VALGGREDLRERIADMKVRVYPLGLSGPLGAWMAIRKVRGILTQMDADLVHGFGSWGGAVAALAAPEGVSVVRSVSRPPASGRDLRGWILGFMERRAARREGVHYVVPDEGAREMVAKHYGGGDTTVLPPSVDIAAIREKVESIGREGGRRHLGVADGETVFACVSPFHSESAMDEILRGVAVARRERPDTRVFLVGGGRYEASSRWKAEELQLDDSVVFLGRGPDTDALWAAADAVVDAAPWAGWSRGAMMGQAAGLPVVKRVDGVVNGGLTEDADTPKISGRADWFAADLVRLAEDGELRRRLGERSRDAVAGNDAADVADELRQLYKRLA